MAACISTQQLHNGELSSLRPPYIHGGRRCEGSGVGGLVGACGCALVGRFALSAVVSSVGGALDGELLEELRARRHGPLGV